MTGMDNPDAEVERLRALLKVYVARQGTLRRLEPKSRRKVRSLLREGDMTLTLDHVLDLLAVVGVSAEEFFVAAFPPREGEPETVELPKPLPVKTPETELEALLAQTDPGELEKVLGRLAREALQAAARRSPAEG